MVTFIQVAIYGLVVWLGCYLIARDLSSWRLRFAGLALVSCGINIALFLLKNHLFYIPFLAIPPLFWLGTIFESFPEDKQVGYRFQTTIRYGLVILVVGLIILSINLDSIYALLRGVSPDVIVWFLISITIAFLLLIMLPVFWVLAYTPKTTSKRLSQVMIIFALFFASGYFLMMIAPLLSNIWILMVSIDLLILGTVIVVWDAIDAGESLLPDMLRSFTSTTLMIIIVVGQVIIITPAISDSTLMLILALMTTVIVVFAFEIPIQNRLDMVIFSRFPNIRQQRQQLRTAETIAIRRVENPILDDETEFIRYTRRALSHYGDLTKLATNPLTHLPIIQNRLAQRQVHDDTLERAKELKLLLTESIMKLKPNGADFGTSDEWRHYNALYFPYVRGLKPYSLRVMVDDLPATERDVLAWFRSQVPERTLYNWQNAAAMLIAQDLRERH